MGFVARRQIRESDGRQRGAGLALAAIIIGFVFVGITLAIIGLVLTSSGSSGPSLSGLTSSVRAQIAGNGSDSLKVPGVASVVCTHQVVANRRTLHLFCLQFIGCQDRSV